MIVPRPDWWEHAKCRGHGTDLFFGPPVGESETVAHRKRREAEAKKVCKGCPSAVPCVADAFHFADEGVRGGLTRYERLQVAPPRIIDGAWLTVSRSADRAGRAVLEHRVSNGVSTFRVRVESLVVIETVDETDAWLALNRSGN